MRRAWIAGAIGAVVLGGCSIKTNEVNTPSNTNTTAAHTNGSTATTKPVAHIGATLTLDSGNEQVTLSSVIDPAQGADQFTTPDAGKRFVATVFTIKDIGTQSGTGDANSNAAVIGSDNQTYSFDVSNVSECTNFNEGEFQLGPGESASGCVVFQLPTAIKVAKVQWSPQGGFASDFGEWLVP